MSSRFLAVMDNKHSPSEEVIQHAIKDLEEPVVFKYLINRKDEWEIFKWKLSEFNEKFDGMKLPFRTGYNKRSLKPQWESESPIVFMTFQEFLEKCESGVDDKTWYYFDYKYMHEWFKDNSEIPNSLNWKKFGFDKNGLDSTIWIGSRGAHTNCHQDSYGCNLVAQIYGRKQWLLFPPSATKELQPSRIPYEESTIYSQFNFFAPTENTIARISRISEKVKLITLEPGDVLFVPKGWWHYVESLNLTISINIWLPEETDNRSRLSEALVQLMTAALNTETQNLTSVSECMQLVSIAHEECKKEVTDKVSPPDEKKMKRMVWNSERLAEEYPRYVQLIPYLKENEFEKFIEKQGRRFSLLEGSSNNIEPMSETVINAFCHPEVIDKVSELIFSKHS